MTGTITKGKPELTNVIAEMGFDEDDVLRLAATIERNSEHPLAYNGLGLPIAMGLLYPFTGILLSPLITAAAMAASSVTVVTNANRLRGWHPKESRQQKEAS